MRSRRRFRQETTATFETSKVTLARCGPNTREFDLTQRDISKISGFHDWENANPASSERAQHAKVRAGVVVGGERVPFTVTSTGAYQRQVDPTTYELMVGPGGNASIGFDLAIADLPMGEGMEYGADVDFIERRALSEF